jgi:hypothetical protein
MLQTEERIRAVKHIVDLTEELLELWAEDADMLTAFQKEVANEAYLPTALDKIATAKESATEALALLRRWLKEAEGL